MLLVLLAIAIFLAFVLAAWGAWHEREKAVLEGVRRRLAQIGLITMTVSWVCFVMFVIHGAVLGGFGHRFGTVLMWARPNALLCILSLVAGLFGKGATRVLSSISAVVGLAMWVIPGMCPDLCGKSLSVTPC